MVIHGRGQALFLLILSLPFRFISAQPGFENIEGFDECIASDETKEYIDLLFSTSPHQAGGAYNIPLTLFAAAATPLNREIPILGNEGFEWLANVLPSSYDPKNRKNINGLPPRSVLRQMLPFFNFQRDASNWGYKKWPATQNWVMAFIGMDPKSDQSRDEDITVFLTNLEDRGRDNLKKKQYFAALTCDKMLLYEEKIDNAIQKLFDDITVEGKPILSSWFERSTDLFLDLHMHGPSDDHPEFFVSYVKSFSKVISRQLESNVFEYDLDALVNASCAYSEVVNYVEQRRQYIVENNITSTFLYWWEDAGVPSQLILSEAVHNIFAWGQHVNMLFLLIRSKLQGYLTIDNLLQGLVTNTQTIDFFALSKEAGSDENARLNVVREAYRLLLPNQVWFSAAETNEAGYNTGRFIADSDFDRTYSFHFPLTIQTINDNYNPLTFETQAGQYDTSRYDDFAIPSSGGCPFAKDEFIGEVEDELVASIVDGETIVPKSHAAYIPVFPSGERRLGGLINGPKYCPFGLGYRRCPGEIFNYVLTQKLLDKFSDLDFKVIPEGYDLFERLTGTEPNFDESVPTGLGAKWDFLFVDV